MGLDDGPNTYAYTHNNPVNGYDPNGLAHVRAIYGDPVDPVASGPTLAGRFAKGYINYFQNITTSTNPYVQGSCLYNQRNAAILSANSLLAVLPQSSTVQGFTKQFIYNKFKSDPAFFTGRAAGNATVAFAVSRIGKGRIGKVGIGASTSTLGLSYTSYIVLVDGIQSQLQSNSSTRCTCAN